MFTTTDHLLIISLTLDLSLEGYRQRDFIRCDTPIAELTLHPREVGLVRPSKAIGSATWTRFMMYTGPDNCVLFARGQASTHDEGQLSLEGKYEQTQALDAVWCSGKISCSARACISSPAAIRQIARTKRVLNHDNEGTCAPITETLKLHLIVLAPAHTSRRHRAYPCSELLLANHALVELA